MPDELVFQGLAWEEGLPVWGFLLPDLGHWFARGFSLALLFLHRSGSGLDEDVLDVFGLDILAYDKAVLPSLSLALTSTPLSRRNFTASDATDPGGPHEGGLAVIIGDFEVRALFPQELDGVGLAPGGGGEKGRHAGLFFFGIDIRALVQEEVSPCRCNRRAWPT